MSPGIIALLLGGLAAIFGLSGGGGSSSGGSSGSSASGGSGNSNQDEFLSFDESVAADIGDMRDSDSLEADALEHLEAIDDDREIFLANNGSWSGPSAEEQLMVELVNRARMDPDAEVDRLDEELAEGIPDGAVQPLAITPELTAAALAHSQDMDDKDFFAHENLEGQSPGDRALEEGHANDYVGENIARSRSTDENFDRQGRIEDQHQGLWESDGHQANLMRAGWSEIGVGYDEGTDFAGGYVFDGTSHITENFSNTGLNYLTGVVIKDADKDDFYDIGEGMGEVIVSADNGKEVFITATWESGGYALPLLEGTYEVTFSGGGLKEPVTETIVMRQDNIKLDVIKNGGTAVAVNSSAGADAHSNLAYLPEVEFDESSIDNEQDVKDEEYAFL